MKPLLTICLVVCTTIIGFSQEQCLKNAWAAYNSEHWSEATKQAENCTIQFGPRAKKTQKDLMAQNYSFPCNPNVPNNCTAQQKSEIFSHGLLNDVAVSYWIIGMCNLRFGNNDRAREAFKNARELTFGLCYNPESNNFWSPSEESELQLEAYPSGGGPK